MSVVGSDDPGAGVVSVTPVGTDASVVELVATVEPRSGIVVVGSTVEVVSTVESGADVTTRAPWSPPTSATDVPTTAETAPTTVAAIATRRQIRIRMPRDVAFLSSSSRFAASSGGRSALTMTPRDRA